MGASKPECNKGKICLNIQRPKFEDDVRSADFKT